MPHCAQTDSGILPDNECRMSGSGISAGTPDLNSGFPESGVSRTAQTGNAGAPLISLTGHR